MRQAFVLVIGVCLVGATAFGHEGQQATPQTPPKTPPAAGAAKPSVDDALKAFREDLQSTRADIVAKNVTLSAQQAARFWPMFEQYQKAQNVIMDEQLKGVQQYVDRYETLDDAGALALINAHLDRDAQM